MTIEYKDSKRIVALSTDEAPTPDLTYDDFPTSYSGWTKSSNDATKLAFSSNRANFSIGETYVDARAYGYNIGFDLDGDYCIDFDFTFTNTPFTSTGQAVAFTFGISTTTADVGGEDPTMNSEQVKIAGYPSGSYTYIYARAKSSAGTNASGNESNTAFPLNSSATQLRYGRLSRSGTTFKVQFFSESTRETEVANYSVTTTAQTVRYLYLKSYSQNSGQAWAGYLDNIKIYKDQSSPIPVKPTNVQDNSILVEKDTARRYWFSEATPTTYETDFSSDPTISSNDTNNNYYDSTNDRWHIQWDWNNSNDSGSIDLYSKIGNQNLSDDDWVVRFKYTIVSQNFTTGSDSKQFFIGLTSTDYSNGFWYPDSSNVSTNFGLYMNKSGTYQLYTNDNSAYGSGTWTNTSRSLSNETIYVELIRENSTTAKMNLYSDSSYSTLLVTVSLTIASGLTGLRYLSVKGMRYNSGASVVSNMDNLEIYNGVASATPDTWTMQPTFQDDFSSDKGWVSSDAQAKIDSSGYLLFDEDGDGSAHIVYYDIGRTLSDTKWLWRFKLTTNTFSMNSDPTPQMVHIRISDNTTQRDVASEDAIGMSFRTSDGNQKYIRTTYSDGAIFGTTSNFSTQIATGTHYVQITRDSSTQFTVKLYSDSSYSTLVESKPITIPSTITDLRYLKIDNYDQDGTGNGTILIHIDDMEVYSGVTSKN